MMMKWKIILVPIGVMHQGRYLQDRGGGGGFGGGERGGNRTERGKFD
jgi:hypothetical protein